MAMISVCGQLNPQASSDRIVGGGASLVNEIPWQAGIASIYDPSGPYCGGTVIGPSHILGAAHCIDK